MAYPVPQQPAPGQPFQPAQPFHPAQAKTSRAGLWIALGALGLCCALSCIGSAAYFYWDAQQGRQPVAVVYNITGEDASGRIGVLIAGYGQNNEDLPFQKTVATTMSHSLVHYKGEARYLFGGDDKSITIKVTVLNRVVCEKTGKGHVACEGDTTTAGS